MSQVRRRRTPASPERVRVLAEPCACDERGGVCGFHYAQMDDYRQSQARKRAGVTFGHGNGR